MSLMEVIEKIQKKPESSRKKILSVFLIVIMAIIISIWLLTLKFSLREIGGKDNVKAAAKPFAIIKEEILNFYGSVKNATNK